MITGERASSGFENRAEASGFYRADLLRGSGISAEPVVVSRATLKRLQFSERRDGVKLIFFTMSSSDFLVC
tara:strand:+ start:86413 stop:86625 length:213 start_codon:yes stop_codon:yes gene_type:complete